MTTLIKPTWWDALSAYYGFSNNDEILESDNVRQTLTDYLTGHFADLLSPAFMASQHVVKNSAGDTTKPEINIAPAVTASEVIGRAGADYLAGSSADDILYGDANNDFFTPSAAMTSLSAAHRSKPKNATPSAMKPHPKGLLLTTPRYHPPPSQPPITPTTAPVTTAGQPKQFSRLPDLLPARAATSSISMICSPMSATLAQTPWQMATLSLPISVPA